MTQKNYPQLLSEDVEGIVSWIKEVSRTRDEDVGNFDNLPSTFMKGRKVDKVPTAYNDTTTDDREGDFNFDKDYYYYAVSDSGTLKWARVWSSTDTTWTSKALGTAAYKNTGTTNGTIPLLDSVGYPAVDGSQITNLPFKLVLIDTETPSGASTVDFTDLSSDYFAYLIYFQCTVSTDGADLQARTDANNGASFDTGASDYGYTDFVYAVAATGVIGDAAASFILLADDIGNGAAEGASGCITIYNPSDTAKYPNISSDITNWDASSSAVSRNLASGQRVSAAAINAFRIFPSAGTITGTFKLYGLKAT